jgi:hypothetical protein
MKWFITEEFGSLISCRNLVVVVGIPWVYTNQWAWRFSNAWNFVDVMDVKNLLQKLNNPPLGVGHCNFLSHAINTSMTIFMIWLKYQM